MSAPSIVSYGMGWNSTALLIECVRRHERVDLILAADTGDEDPRTYHYRDEVFGPWLMAHGMPPITVVRWIRMDGSFESLSANCLRTHSLPSKAYGLAGCTSKWKSQPLDKAALAWMAEHGHTRADRIIGYHALERRRIDARRERDAADAMFRWRYPLAEWGYDTEDCGEIITAAGLPLPPRSWCRFCPNKLPPDVLRMKEEDPEGLALGVAIEAGARIESPDILGLGRSSFSWRGLLDADRRQVRLDLHYVDNEMPCGCADGGDE